MIVINLDKIKLMINFPEYDFLRMNPKLNNNIILLTLGGSHAYGTNISTPEHESDLDLRGIYLNNAKEILTMKYDEEELYEDDKTDTSIYSLRKMVNLLIACNPSILEIIGTKEEHLLTCTEEGYILRDNVDLFLSRRIINSYSGYASQQLSRLENALFGDDSKNMKEKHMYNSINNQMLTMKDRYQEFTNKEINVYIDKSSKKGYENEIFIDTNLIHYPLRDFKNIITEMSNVIKTYDKLNHRNKKKDEMHLLKHSMHLIRIMICGIDLLEGKKLYTYMEESDRQLLLDIRNGKYSYKQIFEMADEYNKKFEYAKNNTCLPEYPDFNKIEDLTIDINKKLLYKKIYFEL